MKWFISLSLAVVFFTITTIPVHAICPLCTVAVGAGLGFSRWLGIDDVISGIWVGGLILSTGLWLADWIKRKNWLLPWRKTLSVIFFSALTIIPLYWLGLINTKNSTLWGINKLFLGTGIGFLVFLLSVDLDKFLRHKNGGKVHIYYQKVILPLFLLTLTSFIFYFITR